MANIFKKSVVRYLDAQGRRVSKDSPGAEKIRQRSRKWYGKYRDAEGVLHIVPLFTDKAASKGKTPRNRTAGRRDQQVEWWGSDPAEGEMGQLTGGKRPKSERRRVTSCTSGGFEARRPCTLSGPSERTGSRVTEWLVGDLLRRRA